VYGVDLTSFILDISFLSGPEPAWQGTKKIALRPLRDVGLSNN
jgi:hypothetical protein